MGETVSEDARGVSGTAGERKTLRFKCAAKIYTINVSLKNDSSHLIIRRLLFMGYHVARRRKLITERPEVYSHLKDKYRYFTRAHSK